MAVKIIILLYLVSLISGAEDVMNLNETLIQNVYTNDALTLTDFPGENCNRKCIIGDSRVCYFKWHLEHYHTNGPACGNCSKGVIQDCYNEQCVTADGLERGIMSINRKMPGPEIHVCKNDQIVVDVVNMMAGASTTLHWHGFHQRETPWMDGVPFITQCPIDFSTTFRYSFKATEAGTQFYHSHAGHHKVNGLYGGIVVRDFIINEKNSHAYDIDEHLFVASDWMKDYGEMFMPGLPTVSIGIQPTTLLINGRGRINNADTRSSETKTPYEIFKVTKGFRYRFRFVNSASHVCPLMLEVEGHSLTVIASDSYHLQPLEVDTLITTSGERYDFVINAYQPNQKANYWMRLRAIGPCSNNKVEQFAILSYENVENQEILRRDMELPAFDDDFGRKRFLNHPNATCNNVNSKSHCIIDCHSYNAKTDILKRKPDFEFYLGFNNYPQKVEDVFAKNNYGHFMNTRNDSVLVGAVNQISFVFPSISLVSQKDQVTEQMFCDVNNLPASCLPNRLCPCIHRIKIPLNSIVDLVIVDETREVNPLNHPFHLHGYPFYVLEMHDNPTFTPMTVTLARRLDVLRAKSSPNPFPPIKDTVSIPSRGRTRLRFKADNPGFWLMHCHFEWHMAVGMGLVVQVGEVEDMLTAPKGFPKCGDYKPKVNLSRS